MSPAFEPRITVVGLGYVGLPLAIALAEHFDVVGLDVDTTRIDQLRNGIDRTREISPDRLARSRIALTCDPPCAAGSDVYIVTVPTPVDRANRPDLRPLLSATNTVASLLKDDRVTTIVYESTVYPGVTEEICGPEIEQISGLKRGVNFKLGYSPERINPGDKQHRIDAITKVVAAEDEESLDQLTNVYGRINGDKVFRAASIRAAEAAKVIENAQRDINIAFINEITQIFAKLGLSIWDVLDAARTKWNFLPFEPGIVGGHCIGVDPYYLSHLAQEIGHWPQIILAGRGTNDAMGEWIADRLHEKLDSRPGAVLILGLTFKENVPDLRNSRVVDIVRRLRWLGHQVDVADPLADPDEASREYGIELVDPTARKYDVVLGAVAHDAYRSLSESALHDFLKPDGVIADLKGIWRWTRSCSCKSWTL